MKGYQKEFGQLQQQLKDKGPERMRSPRPSSASDSVPFNGYNSLFPQVPVTVPSIHTIRGIEQFFKAK